MRRNLRRSVEEPNDEPIQAPFPKASPAEVRPVITISDAQWHSLWEAYHGHKTETLRIDRAALDAMVSDIGWGPPRDLIVQGGRQSAKTVVVNRVALYNFLTGASETYGLMETKLRKKG